MIQWYTKTGVLGQEAHIVSEEDGGPRGDAAMPMDERNAYPNLLLLCPTHHVLVDKDWSVPAFVDTVSGRDLTNVSVS
jgi:hypothetical protein